MGPVLRMLNVTKRFPGVLALNDVNIDLFPGEILGIVGENGAGKSTLMKVLSGSYPNSSYEGSIEIDGSEVEFNTVSDAQRYGIEMVYQEMNMMLDATVAENLFVGNLPLKFGFVDFDKLYADAQKLIDLGGLSVKPKQIVRPLNSGQMQMLSILRAKAKNPKILVLDEPTTALTDSEVETLMDLLNCLRKDGVSCIYISHKLKEIFRICDRVTVIRDGRTISSRKIGDVSEQKMIEEMVGRTVENLYPKKHHPIRDEFFKVENLTVPHPTVKGKNIVENISFSLRRGEILGIGGLVGSGRSETLGAIFGQISKGVSKRIVLEGGGLLVNSPADAIKAGIGFITEERKRNGIVWMLGVRENLSLASLGKLLRGTFLINKKKENDEAMRLFEELRIKAPSLETKLVQLSGGNQQKVILGKWLLNNPKILLIDEPTKGIDVGTKADFYSLMGDLTDEGMSIIMVSSDLPELISMSDRCLVLSGGKITAELSKDEITEMNVMRAAIANELT